MNVLMISPNAPPKNSPESMQVGRYLRELDKHHQITLVTTPVESGWVSKDESLDIKLSQTKIVTLRLPFHKNITRVLRSRYFKPFAKPDQNFWVLSKVANLIKQLDQIPDVIYSRSLPFSAALLAKKVKKQLRVPWIMHLSDPWCDNPYLKTANSSNCQVTHERSCFDEADVISVTTEGLAEFYQNEYPEFAHKIVVSPNVMPSLLPQVARSTNNRNKLKLVYTGALYGQRRPTTLLDALGLLRKSNYGALDRLEVQFVGNVAEDIRDEIDALGLSQISVLGRKNYSETLAIQAEADIMLSFEPDGEHPLLKSFLPSKILDYIAAHKPILAITPEDSESWKLCGRGYGWAIRPCDSEKLAELLLVLLAKRSTAEIPILLPDVPLPEEYSVVACTEQLNNLMEMLAHSHTPVHGCTSC